MHYLLKLSKRQRTIIMRRLAQKKHAQTTKKQKRAASFKMLKFRWPK